MLNRYSQVFNLRTNLHTHTHTMRMNGEEFQEFKIKFKILFFQKNIEINQNEIK